jgi:hypothetical protein
MSAKKMLLVSIASALLAGLSASASAAPPSEAQTMSAERVQLQRDISRARAADPATFRAVRKLAVSAKEHDKRARGGKAPLALHFRALGAKALMPMLEMVAFDAGAVPPEARSSVRRDLVEAIGLLRDARAVPALTEVLAKDTDPAMTRTAAEALGRMDSPEAAAILVSSLAAAQGDRETAILAGMGSCHRDAVARALAAALAKAPEPAKAMVIARSLGRVGNAWAWRTLADRSEESAARATAAEALVAAYVTYRGEAREAFAKALLVVDAPESSALLERARRGASGETALALDALAQRIDANPTR